MAKFKIGDVVKRNEVDNIDHHEDILRIMTVSKENYHFRNILNKTYGQNEIYAIDQLFDLDVFRTEYPKLKKLRKIVFTLDDLPKFWHVKNEESEADMTLIDDKYVFPDGTKFSTAKTIVNLLNYEDPKLHKDWYLNAVEILRKTLIFNKQMKEIAND